MEKNFKKEALIGTIVFHAILLLLLLFFAFKTKLPLPQEMGVEVMFGGGGGGGGSTSQSTVSSSSPVAPNEITNPAITQNNQPVVTQTAPSEVISPPSQTQKVVKQEPVVDQRITDFWGKRDPSSSQGTGSGTGSGQGTGTGQGTGSGQGSGEGSGVGSGTGDGSGPNFSLHGRSARYIPAPDYTEMDQGRVVVDVWVDKNGNVTKAIAGARGTTTSNPSLWRKSQQAALSAKFSVNLDAPEEQKGTITYSFVRFGN